MRRVEPEERNTEVLEEYPKISEEYLKISEPKVSPRSGTKKCPSEKVHTNDLDPG